MVWMEILVILVRDFVDDVERYCLQPGVRREPDAYHAYVTQTCYEIARGGVNLDKVNAAMLRATLLVVAPTVRVGRTSPAVPVQTVFTAGHLNVWWRRFVDACIEDLNRRAKSWATTVEVGGQTIALGDWVDDKHYTTVVLNKSTPPMHGTRRRGRRGK